MTSASPDRAVAENELPAAIAGFLAAINRGDAADAGAFCTDDVSYQVLVPHPPAIGRADVVAVLDKSISEAGRVDWEVVNVLATEHIAYVERIDRFFFGEKEAAIECIGIFELRDGLIAAVRDYADLDSWRRRKAAALE